MTHAEWEKGKSLTVDNATKTQLKWMVIDRDARIKRLYNELEKSKRENKILIESIAELVEKVKKLENSQ